jgi:pimeloyl-ACP methyl ester carboxylesterase
MPTITINQQPIFYANHKAAASDKTVILIHGAGGSHLVWPAALRRLPNADVLALDLPGHGRSPGSGSASIDDYAGQITAFLDTLKLENVFLIGHSMGGAIAQTVALRQPPALAGLVLIGTGAKLRVAPAILDNLLPHFGETAAAVNRYTWGPNALPEMVARGEAMLAETPPPVLHGDFVACDRFDVRAELSGVTLPTLVIAGSADKMTPPKYGRYLAGAIPHAQFLLLEGAGHMMMVEKPGETAAAVERFLDN